MQRTTAVVCALLAAASSIGAEERLSDIAGSIVLQRPEGERLVVVEPQPEPSGARVAVDGSDLVEMTEQLLARGRAAAAILQETRTSLAFFDDGWRRRMLAAFGEIDTARIGLELCKPAPRYVESAARVLEGARQYQVAAGIVRWAMMRDQALFSGAFEHLSAGDHEVGSELARLRGEARKERSESESAPVDAFAASQSIATVCGSRDRSGGQGAHDRCVSSQLASLESLQRRFSFTVGLDEASFNSIRHDCRNEWRNDLAGWDRCERQRMAAAPR